MKYKKEVDEILFKAIRKHHHTDTEYRRKKEKSLIYLNLKLSNLSDMIQKYRSDGQVMDDIIKNISITLRINLDIMNKKRKK